MKYEIAIYWSDGRVKRETFDPVRGDRLEIVLERHLDVPALRGTIYGPRIEVRPTA